VVEGIQGSRGPEFMTSNELSRCVRLGIEEKFTYLRQPIPKVNLKEPDVKIVAFSRNLRCSIGVYTSGKALHKRGYKNGEHSAPLKETLAAAVLYEAGYTGDQPLVDAMCGSGTLAIEAAMIALNKAPLIHRKKDEFGFEKLKLFNRELWRKVQDQVRAERKESPQAAIYAQDIDPKAVAMTKDNALRARVERFIDARCSDFFESSKPSEKGLIVMNLPYGERLGGDDLEDFYARVGQTLKHNYQGWTAAILTSEDAPISKIGLKPKKKKMLLNGSIRCKLMTFELFSGSHKEFKTARNTPAASLT
jgi:putative N6-adenine-specific DNA methylase